MNRTLAKIFAVSMLLMLPSFAYAMNGAHDPANSGLGYTCSACHKGSAAAYLYPAANVCITCHNGTKVGPGQTQVSYFDQQDYASVVPDGRVNPKQTSHKWFGSDTVPQAKALPPTDPYSINKYGMNRLGYSGQNICSRCHAVHNDSQNSDPVDYAQSSVAPYVRALNTKDQMCLDCHRQRNTQSPGVGTHVVQVSYTSASAKAKVVAGELKATPYQNAVNPTAQMSLKKGLVVCSSCHGVHFADSDSATFDNHSTSKIGGLSQSNGSLLRVSLRGADAANTTINICTNCHTKKNHNHGGQNIQCVDCHNAHVDTIDASDPVQTPNKYLLRRYMNYSGLSGAGQVTQLSSYRKRAVYTDSSLTTARWADANGTGICQTCHNLPSSVSNHATYAADPAKTRNDCIVCHPGAPHTDQAAAGNCTDCHGQPPIVNTVGGPTGKASGYATYNEATTPHGSHALGGGTNYLFGCSECHQGNNHNSGSTYSDVFITKTGIKAGGSAAYSAPNCSTVYCHSNGNGTYKTVSWNGTKGSIIGLAAATRCATCHDNTTIATGAHVKHITTMGYGCVTCHAATVSDNTTLLPAAHSANGTHVNTVKDVSFSGNGAAVGTSCTNVACHSNGKGAASLTAANWTNPATGTCGSCHATSVSGTFPTGSHAKHFTILSDTTNAKCNTCHVYNGETAAPHVSSAVDMLVPSPTVSCGTCHADPYSAAISVPAWGSSNSGCNSCHTAYPIGSTGPATGSHVKHNDTTCIDCHAAGTTSTTPPTTGHGDGEYDIQGYSVVGVPKHAANTGYTGTCSTASCHANPYATTGSVQTPVWGDSTKGCSACHSAFPITSIGPVTGSHAKHNDTTCTDCHTAGTTATTVAADHRNGTINIAGYSVANVTKHTANSGYTGTCSAASCHANPYATTGSVQTPVWGDTTKGCSVCHSAYPIASTGPATGSHAVHNNTNCVDCHTTGTTATTYGADHRDGNIDIKLYAVPEVTKHAANSGYTGTCSTTTCHGTTEAHVWGFASGNATCAKCHHNTDADLTPAAVTAATRYKIAPADAAATDTGKVSTTNSKTGAHQTHLQYFNGLSQQGADADARCNVCHGALPASPAHANGSSTPVFQGLAKGLGTYATSYNAGTCAVYCHNPTGTGGVLAASNAPAVTTVSWTNSAYIADGTLKTDANCNKCHKSPNGSNVISATVSHSGYTLATACTPCHEHEGGAGGTAGRQHMDGSLYGSGGANGCKGCHGYDSGSWATAPAINPEGKGAHEKHIAFLTTKPVTVTLNHLTDTYAGGTTAWTNVCGVCHGSTAGNHTNGTVNVTISSAYLFGTSGSPTYSGSPGVSSATTAKTCSNISCHYFTTPLWSTY